MYIEIIYLQINITTSISTVAPLGPGVNYFISLEILSRFHEIIFRFREITSRFREIISRFREIVFQSM